MDDQQLFLRKLNRRTRFTQFLVWIALFFTAAGIAAGYKNWLRIHQKAKAGLAGIAEIREEIPTFANKELLLSIQNNVNKKLNNNTALFENSLKELRQIQKSTKHIAETVYDQAENISKLYDPTTSNKQSLLNHNLSLLEVRFLLNTAIHTLNLKHDKTATISALKLADSALLKNGSNHFFPLREKISNDLALLSLYQQTNTQALSEEISLLQMNLNTSLTQKNNENRKMIPSPSEKSTKNQNSIISRVTKTLNEAVVIRKFNQPLHVKINEETKDSLVLLLSFKLEALRIMLLQAENKNYHQQIKQIDRLLKKYYPEDKYRQFKQSINNLASVNLIPDAPDISQSLKLFDDLFSSLNNTKSK